MRIVVPIAVAALMVCALRLGSWATKLNAERLGFATECSAAQAEVLGPGTYTCLRGRDAALVEGGGIMPQVCEQCKAFMLELLDKRIRKILEVSHADGSVDLGQAQCFQLMEVQRILRGEPTCGVFDDYGKVEDGE